MANTLLLFAFLAFLLILLGIIALVIYFSMRKRGGNSEVTVVVHSESGSALCGIDVKLGDRVMVTDPYGKAVFEGGTGIQELRVMAEGHSEFRQKIDVSGKRTVQAKLQVEKPSPELRRLEAAVSSARRGRDELGSAYNPTIPDFMLGLCLAIYRMALEEAKAQQDKKTRTEALKSAELAISQTSKGMLERRNLSLYANAKGKKDRQLPIPEQRTTDLIEAKKKLSGVDFLITKLAGKNAIYPPLVLWKTSQKLLSEPTMFNMRLAVFLLDSAELMIAELGDYMA